MRHNGPEISRCNVEWFEHVCPAHITQKAKDATKTQVNLYGRLLPPWAVSLHCAESFWRSDKSEEVSQKEKEGQERDENQLNSYVFDIKLNRYVRVSECAANLAKD